MSSDAMTYALENGDGVADPRSYKTRLWEEWFAMSKKCKLKQRSKQRICSICKISEKPCVYKDCYIRFCQTIKP